MLGQNDILDHLTTAVIALDRDLRVRYVNSAGQALFGTSDLRSAGIPFTELLRPEDPEIAERLGNVLTSGQSLTRRAVDMTNRDGLAVTVDLTVSYDAIARHLIVEMQPINRLMRINRDDHSVFSRKPADCWFAGWRMKSRIRLAACAGRRSCSSASWTMIT